MAEPSEIDEPPTAKRAPGRPRSLPIDEQRHRILVSARHLFAEFDFHGTSIEAVASEADLPRRLVYELFGTKEGLFLAVTNDAVERIVAGVRPEFGDAIPTPRELVRAHVAALFDFIEREPDVAALLRIVEYGSSGPARSEVSAGRRSIEEALALMYRYGTDAIAGVNAEAARLLAVLSLSIVEAVGYRQLNEPGWEVEDTIEFLTDYIVGGISRLGRKGKLESFSEGMVTDDA